MANPHDEFAVAVIKNLQIVGRALSENLFIDHVVFCYMKGLCRPLFNVYHITGRRKGKDLEVPCKYNYYDGSTKDPAFIQNRVFIFVTMLFPLATN